MDKLPIKNWPVEERPREKLAKFGKEHLTSCELLAIIIGTGCMKDNQSYSALDLASNLISKYSNLKGMLDLSITELSEIKGIGMVKAVQILAAFELGKRAVSEKMEIIQALGAAKKLLYLEIRLLARSSAE